MTKHVPDAVNLLSQSLMSWASRDTLVVAACPEASKFSRVKNKSTWARGLKFGGWEVSKVSRLIFFNLRNRNCQTASPLPFLTSWVSIHSTAPWLGCTVFYDALLLSQEFGVRWVTRAESWCPQWPRSYRDQCWQHGRASYYWPVQVRFLDGSTPKSLSGSGHGDNMGFCPFCLSVQFLSAIKSSQSSWRGNGKTKAKSMGSTRDGCTRWSLFKEQNEAVHDKILLPCLRPCLWIHLWCRNLQRELHRLPFSVITTVYDFPIQYNKA